jgi:UDP-glucose 4-epimerase
VAGQLLQRTDVRVLGIDRRPPGRDLAGLDFVKADVRNPLLVDLLLAEGVDTVIHLAFRERQWRREQDFESNVMGTMMLVGACAEAGVRQLVLKSTSALYGAMPESSMYVPEDWPLQARPVYAYLRDTLDIEQFLPTFCREYPGLRVVVLRFPNVVGPGILSPFVRLLQLPMMPTLLGFDPVLQVIDADDAVAALVHAALVEADGPCNVAASGVVTLHQVAGVLGRPLLPLPHLPLYWSWGLLSGLPAGRRSLGWLPLEPDYLRFPWTAGLTRMREVLGFTPRRDALEAVRHYVETQRISHYRMPADLRPYQDDHLDEILAARRRARQADAASRGNRSSEPAPTEGSS